MRALGTPEGRLAIICVAVFALMAALSPERFLSAQNLTSMAFQFPEFAILALAMTVAMLTGGIDLSVVGVSNLSAVIAASVLVQLAGEGAGTGVVLLSMALALGVGLLAGLFNGALVAKLGLPPILATLGSGLIFTGLAIALTGGSAVMGLPPAAAWIGNGTVLGVPVPLILFALLAGGLALVLGRTAFGVALRMYGANPLAARFAAVDVDRTLIRVYAASGMLAAVAGMVVMSRANSAKADYGSSYLLLAVLIAVLGGVNPYGGYGRVIGVVLAVLSMQFLSSGLNMLQVSNFARELIWGLLLIGVMLLNTSARANPPEGTDEEAAERSRGLRGRDAGGPCRGPSRALPARRGRHAAPWRGRIRGRRGRSGIVSGGGSGHLPVFTGYVGTGLLDACAIGDVFNSAHRRADGGRDPGGGPGGRGAAALRELRRRRDELRHGRRPRGDGRRRDDDRAAGRRRGERGAGGGFEAAGRGGPDLRLQDRGGRGGGRR